MPDHDLLNQFRRVKIAGLDHPKRMFDLTEGLVRRRYQDRDIKLILGNNFARVLAEIWPKPTRL
jgi:membrane dipeptidase